MKPLVSICIPTYEMHGLGPLFLSQSLNIISSQSYKNIQVVISDNSNNDDISDVCRHFSHLLDIRYFKTEREGPFFSRNLNSAISNADGELIKILFQDDLLADEKSIDSIVKSFDLEIDSWHLSGCLHTKDGTKFQRALTPRLNSKILYGKNTIGPPSVLCIKNRSDLPLFDPNLIWLMDCDYYYRLHQFFGSPKILKRPCVVSRIGTHQVSNLFQDRTLVTQELLFLQSKHDNKSHKSNKNI